MIGLILLYNFWGLIMRLFSVVFLLSICQLSFANEVDGIECHEQIVCSQGSCTDPDNPSGNFYFSIPPFNSQMGAFNQFIGATITTIGVNTYGYANCMYSNIYNPSYTFIIKSNVQLSADNSYGYQLWNSAGTSCPSEGASRCDFNNDSYHR